MRDGIVDGGANMLAGMVVHGFGFSWDEITKDKCSDPRWFVNPEKKVSGTFVVDKTVVICSHCMHANARMPIFESYQDFAAFERILTEARDRYDMRILAYCLLSNHWHLVLWPTKDGDLSRFTGWVALTHTQRWHAHRRSAGTGHVYQGRFKSFPIQGDDHFYAVCYAERNALRGVSSLGC